LAHFATSFLVFKSKTQNLRVPIKNIVRAEIAGRRVAITLLDEVVYFPGKLTELLDELPKDQFIRCHQAFILNILNTKMLSRQSAFSVNGVEIPVSRSYAKDVQKALLKLMRDR